MTGTILRRLTFRGQSSSNAASSSGFRTETFREDFTGNCKSVSYYLSMIEKHLHPKIINRKKPKAKHVRALLNLKQLLVSFVRDLECNSMGLWFNELVCDQQRGHEVLLKLLSNLVTTPVRAGKKGMSRDGTEQELCAKCLVLISNNRLGLNCLASYEHGYQILLQGLASGRYGAVKHICSILLLYCKLGDSNHSKLISHMECFKKKEGNESKFSVIIKLLSERVEDFTFTSTLLNLLTAVVHSSPSLNIRTFYQQEVELELAVESIIEGVPTTAVSLHKAMREWRDNCIDIPVITRKLEAAQARSGLLQEECRALRDKLGEKEEMTRALARKQQQLLGSHDTTNNELSDMRCRMEDLSKELIREKVKVQRLESTLTNSQPSVNITSLVNNSNTHQKYSSTRRSRGESKNRGQSCGTEDVVHRRKSSARSRRHQDNDNAVTHAQIVADRRLSNRSSSGSDCYHDRNDNKYSQHPGKTLPEQSRIPGQGTQIAHVATKVPLPESSNTDHNTSYSGDLPPLPRKMSTLSRRRVPGLPPPAPPAPAPPAPPAHVMPPAPPPTSTNFTHTPLNMDFPPLNEIPPAPPLPSELLSVSNSVPPAPPLPPQLAASNTPRDSTPAKEVSCRAPGGSVRTSDVKISVKTSYKTSAKPATEPSGKTSPESKSLPSTAVPESKAKPAPAKVPAPPSATSVAPPTAPPKAPVPPKAPTSAPKAPGAPSAPRAPGAPSAPRAPGAPCAPGAPPPSAKMTLSKQPQVKLPLLHWNAVRRNNGTYWNDVNMGEMLDKLDLSQFEEQFKLKTKPTLSNVTKIIKRKVECLSLLDTNRARNAMIIQRRVALQPSDVARCVEQTDLGDLPLWAVELLHGCIPSREEADKLISNSTKLNEYGEAELFCFHLSKVNRYDRKLGLMQFIGTFDEQYARLSGQVNAVKEASHSITVSDRLKKVLEIILALGNFMNSQRKGLAVGFKIQSLSKIAETHSGDYKFTLLHYIVKTIHANMPELIGFTMEFEHLESAQKVLLKELISEIQEMKNNLDTVLDERNKQRDNFVIFSFYNRATRKVKRLGEQARQMLQSYETVCKGFGENPQRIEPQEFFKYFSEFFLQFDNIEKSLYLSEEKKKKKKAVPLTRDVSRNLIEEAMVQHSTMY